MVGSPLYISDIFEKTQYRIRTPRYEEQTGAKCETKYTQHQERRFE